MSDETKNTIHKYVILLLLAVLGATWGTSHMNMVDAEMRLTSANNTLLQTNEIIQDITSAINNRQVPAMIIAANLDILSANPRSASLLGLTLQELIGSNLSQLVPIEAHQEYLQGKIIPPDELECSYDYISPDGKTSHKLLSRIKGYNIDGTRIFLVRLFEITD